MNQAVQLIPDDWYPGTVPGNVVVDSTAHVASSFAFRFCRSERLQAVTLAQSAALHEGAVLVVGRDGQVRLDQYAFMAAGTVFCDSSVELGACSMVAWDAVIMDSYLLPLEVKARRTALEAAAADPSRFLPGHTAARPITIGRNVWISFSACILPGVRIGDGAVVGARAVVVDDVPPFTIVAGNPACVVRALEPADLTLTRLETKGQSAESSRVTEPI